MTDAPSGRAGDGRPGDAPSPGSAVPADATASGGTVPGSPDPSPAATAPPARTRPARKQVLLRLDPAIHDALARWAADDLRSVNAQIDMLLREALRDAGRLPRDVRPPRRPGRPSSDA
jgi:hypothetical protein